MIRVDRAFCAATFALILGYLSFPVQGLAQQADPPPLERRLPAARATGPITMNGMLEEPAWAEAPMAHNFIQNDPREGEPATFDTEVRVLYDDDALYFGVVAHDAEPGRIIVNDIKKDFNTASGDGFRIILDTFHDERNGYSFATNPAGAKWDAQMTNEGRENNPDWDGIWDVATRITETGWNAEIRIPFRTLKFDNADVQTWGVNFERKLRRLNEDSYWAPLPRIYDLNRVSMAGTVEDLRGLRPGLNLRFKPYAATNYSGVAGRTGSNELDGGLDVKYGVSTGFVWDFTVNTDFSQVEADEQQINLTRFSLFFPEKRDFFLENSGIFQFGTGGRVGGQRTDRNEPRLFFSRRIGLSDTGEAIPILAGTRLTGRQGAYSMGVLNIQQREHRSDPAANLTAIRLQRDVLANSDIGAVLLNKDDSGPQYSRMAGLDANFRFGFLSVNGYLARAFSPDAGLSTEGNAYASRAGLQYESPAFQFQAAYSGVGQQFTDEMGYVPRRGVHGVSARIGPRLRPALLSNWVREITPHWELNTYFRQDSRSIDSSFNGLHWHMAFQDGSGAEIGINPQTENVTTPFTISSSRRIVVNPGRYQFNEYFAWWNTNSAARLSFNTRYGIGPFYDGHMYYVGIGPSMRLNEHLNASVNLQINDVSLSTGSVVSNLLAARVNYSFNTKMFFNALVQYNSDNQQWTSNLRFNIIHRPLSDFFLVYNERRDDRTGVMLSRAVIAKMTYLMAF